MPEDQSPPAGGGAQAVPTPIMKFRSLLVTGDELGDTLTTYAADDWRPINTWQEGDAASEYKYRVVFARAEAPPPPEESVIAVPRPAPLRLVPPD